MRKVIMTIFLVSLALVLTSFKNCLFEEPYVLYKKTGDGVIRYIDYLGHDTDIDANKLFNLLEMTDATIDNLSHETISDYKNAKRIISITKKINIEEQSLDEEAPTIIPNSVIIDETYWGEGDIPDPNKYTTYYEDNSLEITYTVLYLGEREYKFITEATWLREPVTTFLDSLGAMSMNMTVINESRNGWYTYDQNIIKYDTYGELISDEITHINTNISEENYHNAINGNWFGSACTFDVPKSDNAEFIKIWRENFKVHYEFNGHYNGELNTYFNTVATYDHSEISFVFDPEINISLSSDNFGIGLASALFNFKHKKYNAEFSTDIKYEY